MRRYINGGMLAATSGSTVDDWAPVKSAIDKLSATKGVRR